MATITEGCEKQPLSQVEKFPPRPMSRADVCNVEPVTVEQLEQLGLAEPPRWTLTEADDGWTLTEEGQR